MNNDYDDDDTPIPIEVPVIIEKDRFLRVSVRRTSRSPSKKAPLHVTPRTLLTGLCHCGTCGSPMHIATGKGGRYRYLKCNRRTAISNTDCESPNVPYEKFERLIIQSVIENVLTDKRLKMILQDCMENMGRLSGSQKKERTQLLDYKKTIQRKLNNLFKLVEDEGIRIDSSLSSRMTGWQNDLDEINNKLNSLKVAVTIPNNVIANIDLTSFRSAMTDILSSPASEEAKSFMHLVVEDIRIYAEDATISGTNLGVLEAALEQTRDTVPTVPSFMHNWRRGRDSNPR